MIIDNIFLSVFPAGELTPHTQSKVTALWEKETLLTCNSNAILIEAVTTAKRYESSLSICVPQAEESCFCLMSVGTSVQAEEDGDSYLAVIMVAIITLAATAACCLSSQSPSNRDYIKAVLTWNMSMLLFWCRRKYFSCWKTDWIIINLSNEALVSSFTKKKLKKSFIVMIHNKWDS